MKVYGWVHTLRSQGSLQFLELRDGTGIPALLQTVFAPPCSQTFDAISLHREASVVVFGTLKADERAKGGVELQADYWELIGVSNGEVEGIINKDSNPDVLADQRHIAIRDINAGYILKLRSTAIHWSAEAAARLSWLDETDRLPSRGVSSPASLPGFCFFSLASASTSSTRTSRR